MHTIVPHLWYDKQAKEAAQYYVEVFSRYGETKITDIQELHNTPSGDVDVVSFEILGQPFQAISAGPYFKFNEAVSFIVNCDSQEEIDYYWGKLSAVPEAEQCGWCKDKFGLSWQIVPSAMQDMMAKGTPEQKARVTKAFLAMKKFDIAELQKAYDQN